MRANRGAGSRERRVNLLWLLAIGIGVQASWELVPSMP